MATQIHKCEEVTGRSFKGTVVTTCLNKASVQEPATRDQWDYYTDSIKQVPNVKWSSDSSYEGKWFCGNHSPSRKSAREAAKRAAKHAEEEERMAYRASRRSALDDALATLEALATTPEAKAAYQTVKTAAAYGSHSYIY